MYKWESTSQMIADVQGWLDNPATNFGLALVGGEAPTDINTAKAIVTREDVSTTNGNMSPRLVIHFTKP